MNDATIFKLMRATPALLIAAALLAPAAGAQESASESDAPKEQEQQTGDEERQESLPGLDELLGIPEEERPSEGDAEEEGVDVEEVDPNRAELERALEGVDISEMFAEAVRQMDDAANLLEKARDPGVRTQRIQEEILRKLDVLIEKAEQQQSSSSSSSSSSQSQSQSQQQPPDQQQKQQQSSQPQRSQGEPSEGQPPGRRDGPLGEALDAAKAAWGALPARVRNALVEGADEKFSSIYKRMTEEYYRRLAEQEQPE